MNKFGRKLLPVRFVVFIMSFYISTAKTIDFDSAFSDGFQFDLFFHILQSRLTSSRPGENVNDDVKPAGCKISCLSATAAFILGGDEINWVNVVLQFPKAKTETAEPFPDRVQKLLRSVRRRHVGVTRQRALRVAAPRHRRTHLVLPASSPSPSTESSAAFRWLGFSRTPAANSATTSTQRVQCARLLLSGTNVFPRLTFTFPVSYGFSNEPSFMYSSVRSNPPTEPRDTHGAHALVGALARQLLGEARHLFGRLSDRLRTVDQVLLGAALSSVTRKEKFVTRVSST